MAVKKGKRKLLHRSVRGTNAARRLARKIQNRAQAGLATVLAGGYDTNNLLDDVMEGWTDVVDAFRGPGGSGGGLPCVTFIAGGAAPPLPPFDFVDLAESVRAGQIERTDLVGITISPTPGAPTLNTIGAADYQLLHPETSAVIPPGSNEELDEVIVEFLAMPAANRSGIYRGFLTLQSSQVLAEVIFIRRA
jgi:hypothetical protein